MSNSKATSNLRRHYAQGRYAPNYTGHKTVYRRPNPEVPSLDSRPTGAVHSRSAHAN